MNDFMETDKKQLAFDVFKEMMSKDHCSQWMGIDLISIDEGYCKLSMTVKKEMLNGFGILHGGIAYAFADSAFAFASNSFGKLSVSINGSMSFHKSAHIDEILTAEAVALHVGKKTADFDVHIYNQHKQRLYSFRGTVYRTTKQVVS